jgi:hypothetical protein
LPIFTDGVGAVLRSCQKKAVKPLKSFARVHLYGGAFQARRPVLIQAELRAALDGPGQVAERIRSTFLEFGIALVSTQVLRRHGMMTHRAHLPCFKYPPHAAEDGATLETTSANAIEATAATLFGHRMETGFFILGASSIHLKYQVRGRRTLRGNSGAFWEADERCRGVYSAACRSGDALSSA